MCVPRAGIAEWTALTYVGMRTAALRCVGVDDAVSCVRIPMRHSVIGDGMARTAKYVEWTVWLWRCGYMYRTMRYAGGNAIGFRSVSVCVAAGGRSEWTAAYVSVVPVRVPGS